MIDLTPTASAMAELQARLVAAAARGDRAEGEAAHWHAEAARWQHAYEAARGRLAVLDAELVRVKGRLAVCRCRAPLEER